MTHDPSAPVFHIAISDDWEAGVQMGAYEAATRGVLYEPGGWIRAVERGGVQTVLDERYRDLALPLAIVVLDARALLDSGVRVERDDPSGEVRIRGPIPAGDGTVVRAVVAPRREGDRWIAPELPDAT